MADVQNAITKKTAAAPISAKAKAPQTIQAFIKSMEGEIKKALPAVITPERFTRLALSAISNNAKLAACTPMSFIAALMTAAQLGLEPNTPLGQAYLIPYNNNRARTVECQFQLGYRGMIALAQRSGQIKSIDAKIVYENDEFEFEYGLNQILRHRPALSNRGNPVAVYATYHTHNDGYGFEVASIEDIRNHARKYSKAYNSGPWQEHFEEMAKKTVLKAVLKYAPLSSEFTRGVTADETIRAEISDDMFDVPVTYIEVDADTGEVADTAPLDESSVDAAPFLVEENT